MHFHDHSGRVNVNSRHRKKYRLNYTVAQITWHLVSSQKIGGRGETSQPLSIGVGLPAEATTRRGTSPIPNTRIRL